MVAICTIDVNNREKAEMYTKITILGFQEQGIRGAKEELQNLIKTHAEQTITFDCKLIHIYHKLYHFKK